MPRPRGYQLSDETKKRIGEANSRALKGKKQSEETIRKRSASLTGRKRSPEECKHISEGLKTYFSDPAAREKLSNASMGKPGTNTGKHFSEEHKQKIAASHLGMQMPPGFSEKISALKKGNKNRLGCKLSEESKAKIREANSGENSPMWRGGLSYKPYCPKFNKELKENIRNQFDRRCFLCGAEENGQCLHVHHVDYNKWQGCGQKWSLIPLCPRCHSKTSRHRHHYFNLLSNYWAMNEEINFMFF